MLSLGIAQGGILWGKLSRTSSREKPSFLKPYSEVFKTAQKKKRENCWRRSWETWGHLGNVGGMTGHSKMLGSRILGTTEHSSRASLSYLSASADCYFFKASEAWPPDRRMFTVFFFLLFLLFNEQWGRGYGKGGNNKKQTRESAPWEKWKEGMLPPPLPKYICLSLHLPAGAAEGHLEQKLHFDYFNLPHASFLDTPTAKVYCGVW